MQQSKKNSQELKAKKLVALRMDYDILEKLLKFGKLENRSFSNSVLTILKLSIGHISNYN